MPSRRYVGIEVIEPKILETALANMTKSVLADLLAKEGITTWRALGQNFLVDPNFLRYLVRQSDLTRENHVLEIGAGPGLLTKLLAEKAGYVWAIELDQRIAKVFKEITRGLSNLQFIRTNILDPTGARLNPKVTEIVCHHLASRGINSFKVVSNLPYATATHIILALLENQWPLESMILTVQWETALRLVATHNIPEYGSLSVLLQTLAEIKILKPIPPDVFWPRPSVRSALIRIIPKAKSLWPSQVKWGSERVYPILKKILIETFRYPRKQIISSLRRIDWQGLGRPARWLSETDWRNILSNIGIDPTKRPAEIPPKGFMALSRKLNIF